MMKKNQHHNQVRIIGGIYRGRKLKFGDTEGLRPTPDSVRERLFNWLGQDLTGLNVLDLFSGSGALGFEASSRYAKLVTLVEQHQPTVKKLQQNAQILKASVQIVHQDGLKFLKTTNAQYDLVFLDPPFGWQHWQDLFEQLQPCLKVDAQVYIEARTLPEIPNYLSLFKQGRAGQSHYALLNRLEYVAL